MKKTLVFLGLLILVVAFSGCVQETATDTQPDTTQTVDQQVTDETTPEVTPSDESTGSDVVSEEEQNKLNEALDKEPNLANCDSITDSNLKEVCVRNVVTDLAILNNDPTQCDRLSSDDDIGRCKEKVQNRPATEEAEV